MTGSVWRRGRRCTAGWPGCWRERSGEDRVPELAHHLLQGAVGGEDRERAVFYAVKAGDHNMQLLAYEEAAAWFDRALDVLKAEHADDARQGDVLLKWGEASLAAGDVPRARNAYQQAAFIAHRQQDPEQLAEAALGDC